ncbi:ribosome maturation factor RimM [Paraburkholderia silviterrae]|uniref:Ribosome maturation factor RimM n=1 Tax=Paraburkholderia silviterrae TaxID=2528715 RepID=A0A4R5MCW4_9BURK|nr:ribosome maturation factor RimM [Paraburkholderia silviterrae]TDG24815.1 ribosome maturation factor RimM [Paraburkholderia silviterrae]
MPVHDDTKADRGAAAAAGDVPRKSPDAGGKSGAEASSGGGSRKAPSFGAFVRKPAERAQGRSSASASAPEAVGAAEGLRAETAESWPADAVEVGAVLDAYGLKGGLKIAPHAQGGRALIAAKRWWLLKGRERPERHCAVRVSAKVHGDSVVGQLGGVADRDAALRLRGARIYVSRADFPATEADEYYWVDLMGLHVANEAGVELGTVADLIDNGAQSVLRVEYPSTDKDGKPTTGERLIPFVGVFVKTVDLAAKRIVVDWEADY